MPNRRHSTRWRLHLNSLGQSDDYETAPPRRRRRTLAILINLPDLGISCSIAGSDEASPARLPEPEVELKPDERPLVSVVDDDESVRESLPDLLNEFGYSVRTFSSALEFLASDALEQTRCLILDITMPGMTGIELQAELKRRDKRVPIIFITGTRDEAVRARVVELGAAACLTKPFSDTTLLEALRSVMTPN
jgi:CheY-like chemotaxis protein